MPKNRKERAVQRTVYVPKEVDTRILRYIANSGLTYSEAINLTIKNFLKLQANEDELTVTTKIIENTIRKELKPEMERIIKFLAKSTKAGYSSIFILAQVLAYLFNTDDQQDFIKKTIADAESMGYKAVKNYSLEEDIEKMFPRGLKIEDLI